MVDALDSESSVRKDVLVRLQSRAPLIYDRLQIGARAAGSPLADAVSRPVAEPQRFALVCRLRLPAIVRPHE